MKVHSRLIAFTAATLFLPLTTIGCSQKARAERKFETAKGYLEKNNYAAAEIELKNVLTLDGGNAQALKSLGLIWVRQGNSLEGAQILSGAKSKLPADDEIRVNLALALSDLGFIGDGRKELLDLLDRSPANTEAIMLLAEFSMTPEQMAECEDRIERSKATDKAPMLLASALLQLRRGLIESGTSDVTRAIEIDPKFARAYALRGTIFRLTKNPGQAVESMKNASDLAGPRSPETGLYASLLMELKQPTEAISLLKKATKSAPDYLPNWRVLGKIAFSQGNTKEAEEYFSKVLSKNSVDIETGLMMSQLYVQQNEPAKAVDLLEKISRTLPSRPVIDLALAKAYLATGNSQKASETLDRVLAMVPGVSEAILLRTRLHLKDGQPAEAIRLIEPVLAAEPTNRFAQDLLVDAYSEAKQPENAVALLKRQADEAKDDPAPLIKLAQVLISEKKTTEARQVLDKALTISPDNFSAITQLVGLDQQESKTKEASQLVDDYLSRHPGSSDAYLLKAGLCYSERDLKGAEAALVKSVGLKSDNAPAYSLLVTMLIESKRNKEAVDRLEQMIDAAPANNIDARMTLGGQLLELGRNDEALATFEKLAELHPDYGPAYNNLAYIRSELVVNLDKAVQDARKARSLSPRDPSVSDTLGWIEYLRGNYADALPLLGEATAGLPTLPSTHYHLAMTQYMMGQSDEAIAGFKKALSINAPFAEKPKAEERLATLQSGGDNLSIIEKKAEANPNDIVTLLQLARGLAKAGRAEEAVATYGKIIATNPNLEAPYIGQSQLYATVLKNPVKALEAAREARKAAPQSPLSAASLGAANFANGNQEEAYGLLRDASSSLSTNGELMATYAWAAYSLGRIEEARNAMKRAGGLEYPRKDEALDFLTLTAVAKPVEPDSKTLAEKILAKNPDHVPSLMVNAAVQDQEGKSPAETYLKVLSIYPKFDPARKALAILYFADPSKTDEAEAMAVEARKRLRDDSELTGILAIVNFRKGKFDYAAQLLKELGAQRPLSASELFALGISQNAIKQPDNAWQNLAKALAAGLNESEASQAKAALDKLEEVKATN